MAISRRDWNTGEKVTTHTGRVLDVYTGDYRAMSDVYTIATFATVINDDLSTTRVVVNANFECDTSEGHAEIDASPELVVAVKAKAELARIIAQDERRRVIEAEERNRPVKGKMMRVVRGRKVAKGTIGRVFWVRDGRVGLEPQDAQRDARGFCTNPIWISAEYLEAV